MEVLFYQRDIPSRLDAVNDLLDDATAAIVDRGVLSRPRANLFRLCLEEALINSVRHGNQGREELPVHLELLDLGDACLVRICDRGSGFDPQGVPLSDPHQPGGRGVCIMRHFMDKVTYNTVGHCLEMWFGKQDRRVEEKTDEQ